MPRVDPGRGGLRCNGSSRNAVRRWRRVTGGAYGGGGGWGDEPAGRGAGNAEDGIGRVPGMERRWQPVLSFGDLEPGRRLRRAKGFPDCVGQVLPERRESVDAGAARGVRQKSGADDRGRLPRYSMGTDLPPPLPRGIASLVRGADGDWLHSARKPGSWRSWSARSGKGPRGRTGWAGGRAVRHGLRREGRASGLGERFHAVAARDGPDGLARRTDNVADRMNRLPDCRTVRTEAHKSKPPVLFPEPGVVMRQLHREGG